MLNEDSSEFFNYLEVNEINFEKSKDIEYELDLKTNFDSSESPLFCDDYELKNILENNIINNDFEIEEEHFLKKKKRGRKSNNTNSENIHNRFSKDNLVYKLKTQSLNSIIKYFNLILEKKKKRNKLFKIDGNVLKKTKKEFNIDFFQKTIKDILTMKRSSKVKKNKPLNKLIIKQFEKNPKIRKLLNMSLIDYINNIYIKLTAEEFKKNFGIYNKLFKENEKFNEVRNEMENFVQNGVINYFQNKQSRNRNQTKIFVEINN